MEKPWLCVFLGIDITVQYIYFIEKKKEMSHKVNLLTNN